jgi:pimeloyl-ACP methyl ester carboxylesterase
MASLLELSRLSSAVYDDQPAAPGWATLEVRAGGSGFGDGLQAAAFRRDGETIVAFRGTVMGRTDIAADLQLGIGMNTSHFGSAGDFIERYAGAGGLTVCGHSLGGAIAQVVGNRYRIKFATFNAPGVAVLASRNIAQASPVAAAVRVGGAAVSAVLHPVQFAQDVSSSFYRVNGTNIALVNDVVSQIGVHYGRVIRIAGTGVNPLSQHGIATVIEVLQTNPIGSLRI